MPAALVAAEVHDDAEVFLGDASDGVFELRATVAAQRAEHVAGETFGVHAHQHVVFALHRAAYKREVLLAVEQALVDVAGEVAVVGWDARLGDALDELLALTAIADEVGDRDQQQVVLFAELLELREARHVALVLADDLAKDAGRVQAGHPARSTAASVWPARLSTPPSR